MKKNYFFVIALIISVTTIAQTITYEEDFESFDTTTPISSQSSFWRSWSGVNGGADDGFVVNTESLSGDQSLLIDDSEVMDLLLLIPGGPTSGIHTVQWNALIPIGFSGYFNMQADITPDGTAWNQALMGGNNYFNCDGISGGQGGTTGVIDCSFFNQEFTYPEGEWFKITCVYDLDVQVWDMKINDVTVIEDEIFVFGTQEFQQLAGINFFSANSTNIMFIDDLVVAEGELILNNNDVSETNFRVYPNPVNDFLTVKTQEIVENIAIFDLLGKKVIDINPNTISPVVDMSNLNSGMYFANITINGITQTVKVIK